MPFTYNVIINCQWRFVDNVMFETCTAEQWRVEKVERQAASFLAPCSLSTGIVNVLKTNSLTCLNLVFGRLQDKLICQIIERSQRWIFAFLSPETPRRVGGIAWPQGKLVEGGYLLRHRSGVWLYCL